MRGIVLRDAGPMEMLPHVAALAVFMIWLSVRRVSKIAA